MAFYGDTMPIIKPMYRSTPYSTTFLLVQKLNMAHMAPGEPCGSSSSASE